ncbi:MAG TPA: GNAT family N-acetyltransferase, partial [Ktedonobacterales bacterium]
MTSTDETVAFRPAREADHEAVMAFCATTWADGDYIPVVWDQWLADAKGALLVAEVAGEPVALGHLAMVNADEGWIEGIRVAEAARG